LKEGELRRAGLEGSGIRWVRRSGNGNGLRKELEALETE